MPTWNDAALNAPAVQTARQLLASAGLRSVATAFLYIDARSLVFSKYVVSLLWKVVILVGYVFWGIGGSVVWDHGGSVVWEGLGMVSMLVAPELTWLWNLWRLFLALGIFYAMLFLGQDFGHLWSCLSQGKSSVPPHSDGDQEKDQATAPSQTTAPRNLNTMSVPEMDSMGSLASGAGTTRLTSPYIRSPCPYTLAPTTSPHNMRRMQQSLSLGLSTPHRTNEHMNNFPTPGSLQSSIPGTPASENWDNTNLPPYLSPPSQYQYQIGGDATTTGELPKYHFSLQWSTGGMNTVSSDTLGRPSAPRQVETVLRRLQMNRNDLRVWCERLRYWTSEHVMQPLLKKMSVAGQRVTDALRRCGLPTTFPIRSLAPSSGLWSDLELTSDADLYSLVAALQQMKQRASQPAAASSTTFSFITQATPPAPTGPSKELLTSAIRVVKEYHNLCKLLRGDFPNKGILGNCPPGYLASRISAFAGDSCCGAFKWQSGGPWQGRDWTQDLPSDTHVLLYVIAAFFSAPFWIFEKTEGMILGNGGPFCVGSVPTAPLPAFTAILATKPKKDDVHHMKAALLIQPGPSGEPLVLLTLDGKPTVTLSGEWAGFDQIVIWLAYINLELGSKIGPYSLDYLRLEALLEPAFVETSVRQKRFFGII